jgi:hypothetical protein
VNITQLRPGTGIKPMKLPVSEIAHLVIEPTQRCNLGCRICYNRYRTPDKTLDDIRAEIDLGLKKRRLETISILGGEPTLHPDLPAIIRHVKSRKLVAQVLTNGLRLLEPGGPEYLDTLIAAGLDRIVFHVDCGQKHARADADADCEKLFSMAESRRLWAALSVTVYPETSGTIPQLMRRWSHFRFFDGILATLTRDTDVTVPAVSENRTEMVDEYRAIAQDLGVEPVTYLPTSLSDDDVSWLIYFYDINARTGATFGLSPELNRLLRRSLRLIYGRHVFGMTTKPERLSFALYGSALLEILLHPAQTGRFAALMRGSRGARDIRLHYIVLQEGPKFNPEKNSFQICYHCPDATIRNGRLTPVCVADRVSPLPGAGQPRVDEALRTTVYAHLEEL